MKPAGAVGLCAPTGWVGKVIAWHEKAPYSHAIVALGNGKVVDSTSPWTRITDEAYWELQDVEWYEPVVPFTPEEARVLKSVAYMIDGRIAYGYKNLLDFLLKGAPKKRGHFLFCTYLAAEVYMVVRNHDISGAEKPWTVGVEELVKGLRDPRYFRPMDDPEPFPPAVRMAA